MTEKVDLLQIFTQEIDWLQVVLDYGKRFSDVTIEDLGLNDNRSDTKISELHCTELDDLYYHLRDSANVIILSTSEKMGKGTLEYINRENRWSQVPHQILLRLLTEGKEDLI